MSGTYTSLPILLPTAPSFSGLISANGGVQWGGRAKFLDSGADGVLYLERNDGAAPGAASPIGIGFVSSGASGVFLWADSAGQLNVGNSLNSVGTLRAGAFDTRGAGSVRSFNFEIQDSGANVKNTIGQVATSNGVNAVQLNSTNGSLGMTTLSDGAMFSSIYTAASGNINFSTGGSLNGYSNCIFSNNAATVTHTLPAPLGKGRTLGFYTQIGGGTITITSASGSQIYKPSASFAASASIAQTTAVVGTLIWMMDLDGTGWTVGHSTGTWT